VTEKIIEEANFTVKDVVGAPVSVVLGKDEMPFGQDYDKMLSDPLVHNFEIDKVWGVHGILDIAGIGKLAAATYYHRNSVKDDETRLGMDNEVGDNYCARLTVDKLISNIKAEVSYAQESYSSISTADETTGEASVTDKDDERRISVGVAAKAGPANVAVEYIATENRKGKVGYDPGLLSVAADVKLHEKVKVHAKYEKILEDADGGVEEDFFGGGVEFALAEQLGLFAEVLNYNSGDLKDASDLKVVDGSIETSVKIGFRGKY
jgi:predicted porin